MTDTIGDHPLVPESPGEPRNTGRGGRKVLRLIIVLGICGAAIFWAARAVWESRHPALALARGLRSGQVSQRLAAIEEASQLDASESAAAIQPLVGALDDPDPGIRAAAAQALGVTGSVVVRSATDPTAARAAAHGLTECLKDRDTRVRIAAVGALRILAGTASGSPSRGSGRGRTKASTVAAPPPSPIDVGAVTAALLDLVADRETDVRGAALFALATVAPSSGGGPPPALLAALDDESPSNRAVAVAAVASFPRGLDPLIAPLFRHLEHDQPAVREACSHSLGRIRAAALTPAVAPILIAGLGNPDRAVRVHIVALLGGIAADAQTTVPALISVMREPFDSDQREMGDRLSVSYVGPAQQAAQTLGRIAPGTPTASQAIAALTEVVRSGRPERRAAAADALGRFGPAAAAAVGPLIVMASESPTSTDSADNRPAAIRALGRIAPGTASSKEAVATLTGAIKSHSAPIRVAAIEALRAFGPAAATAIPTLRSIRDNDADTKTKQAAAGALEALKDESK
jgi:HEAT repeat protein